LPWEKYFLEQSMNTLTTKLRSYWPLIKSLQTGLLVITGSAGYMSARCPVFNLWTVGGLLITLFLSICGSTILNMWWDRDIDARMARTKNRPLASGQIETNEALRLGLFLSLLGVGLAVAMDALYGLIIFAGLFFDVVIYSMWLKRRTAWGILWGGISGGMPILAGRVLGNGGFDWIGITLALGILFWIPTHIMTFSMKYHQDYKAAEIPTFPSTYGFHATRIAIAVSSIFAALAMGAAAWGIGMTIGYMRILAVLSIGLLSLAAWSVFKPNERVNFGLFKYASLYMLSSMILMMVQLNEIVFFFEKC
jgi:protoheme IX farnesyltransferase